MDRKYDFYCGQETERSSFICLATKSSDFWCTGVENIDFQCPQIENIEFYKNKSRNADGKADKTTRRKTDMSVNIGNAMGPMWGPRGTHWGHGGSVEPLGPSKVHNCQQKGVEEV